MEAAAYTQMVHQSVNIIWIGIGVGVVGLVAVCLCVKFW